jgi:hypothetical protein
LLRATVAVVAILSGIQCASAARIFNFTNQPVDVDGTGAKNNGSFLINLKPGERSESLEKYSRKVTVHHPFAGSRLGAEVCTFEFGDREIVGGNYMLIVQHGTKISCTLCDAGRKPRFKATGQVRTGYAYTTPGKPEHGCE